MSHRFASSVVWRTTLLILFFAGLVGILVALAFKLTVREPPRGYTDPPGTPRRAAASDFQSH